MSKNEPKIWETSEYQDKYCCDNCHINYWVVTMQSDMLQIAGKYCEKCAIHRLTNHFDYYPEEYKRKIREGVEQEGQKQSLSEKERSKKWQQFFQENNKSESTKK